MKFEGNYNYRATMGKNETGIRGFITGYDKLGKPIIVSIAELSRVKIDPDFDNKRTLGELPFKDGYLVLSEQRQEGKEGAQNA